MKELAAIRNTFLEYFAGHGHHIMPSAPLVPQDDPTLMFVNAGMVPFKNYFTGAAMPPATTAVSAQKCVRAGGKHNDLDNVGYTARHHTFFEMLGNFSFGDYFKEQAIERAWDFVTKVLALPRERLLVTIYHEDHQARDLWRRIAGLPDERILPIASSDNFWSMGNTGPCGPCSEIFYDHGDHIAGGPPGSPDEDGDRFVEIWNLVFMQFDQQEDGTRLDLPRPCIDTGMGLERISAIMQGQHDNYDIDIFRKLIEASYVHLPANNDAASDMTARRVLADHLRCAGFLIADGVLPTNEGRGYVLRRILRRGLRYGCKIGGKEPFLHHMVGNLIDLMGGHYQELGRAQALINHTILAEETAFFQTIGRGLRYVPQAFEQQTKAGVINGQAAFRLYDTYGLPLDILQDMALEQGLKIDMPGFEQAMTVQKDSARAAWQGSGGQAADSGRMQVVQALGGKQTIFTGYDDVQMSASQVLALLDAQGQACESLTENQEGYLVLDKTVFYAESGGQIADQGILKSDDWQAIVSDVQRQDGVFFHKVQISAGSVTVGQMINGMVDAQRQQAIKANHSATHILHEVLRRVLGEHVTQKGSLVQPDRLRFDFNHHQALTVEEIATIEAEINAVIRDNGAVSTQEMSIDDAVKQGALALFGEKYDSKVRVLTMGKPVTDSQRAGFSVELCGGIHVARLGDIGGFRIISESSVSSGVRRLEAITGQAASEYSYKQGQKLAHLAAMVGSNSEEVSARIESLLREHKHLQKQYTQLQTQNAVLKSQLSAADGNGNNSDSQNPEMIGQWQFLALQFRDLPAKALAGMVDQHKAQLQRGICLAFSINGDRVAVAVGVTKDALPDCDAVAIVRVATAKIGGKGGGGRPDFAQSGGTNAAAVPEAIAAVKEMLATRNI